MRLIEDAAGIRGREVIPRVIPVANPGAGNDWIVPVPGGVMWLLETVTFRFLASAVVANRLPTLQVTDADGLNIGRTQVHSAITAGTLIQVTFSPYVASPFSAAAGVSQDPIPTRKLYGGWILRSLTTNVDVGDTYTQIVVNVLEVDERPYDVELARDLATLRGNTSNAFPEIREGL